jgi:hypothetical protein
VRLKVLVLAVTLWLRTLVNRFDDRWPPGTAVVTP